ncbi:NAD(P)/FAD-dependent oxidoreductase [Marinibaculum pumilum]|uniref:NAD(P)/FAD-dependent oxidoreductase n=1 Tax=Marinibaculum pumilum TaxID=1766165 RepID=A0ABV7L4R1_9PROT
MSDHRLTVAVIGAGMYGTAAAEWLRRGGHDVILIDRAGPAGGTSFGNAGIISTSSVVPVPMPGLLSKVPKMLLSADGPLFLRWSYLPVLLPWLRPYLRNRRPEKVAQIAAALADLLTDAVEQHLSLARGTPAEAFLTTGDFVYLYPDRAAFEADHLAWELRHHHGTRGALMEGAELAAYDPNLGPHYRLAYAAHNHAWLTDPAGYVTALADWFVGQGGRFLKAEVHDLRPLGSGIGDGVQIDAGTEVIHADRAVIAGGAWSARLAESLGHRTMLESERGYHIAFQGGSPVPPAPYSLADLKFVVTPMAGAVRAAGLVEFGGLEAGPSAAPHALLDRMIRRLYPDFTFTDRTYWQGHRPTTADSLPHIGPAPSAPQILFGFGGQHVGMASGAKAGRLLADLIAGARPNIDMAPFHPGRFDRR